jgi:hypothetical protein
MKIRFKIDLSEGQKEAYKALHNPKIKYMILNWSRQCGKSTFAEIACIESLCKIGKFSAYITPSYKHGQKIYAELMKYLEPLKIVKKSNASDLRIESIFGTVLQFFSGEAPTSIRGNTVSDILIIDEASYFPDQLSNGEDIWYNVIQPITKVRCKKVIMISTPAGKRGFFFNFYNRGMNGKHDDYFCMTRTIYDDKLASEDYINDLKESTPKKFFDQEYNCIFLDSSLTFFEGFENCFKKYDYGYERTWIGVDLSGNGSDETIVTKINENNEVEQIKVSGTLSMKYQQIAAIINDAVNLQMCYIEVNGLGAPMYQEIMKLVKNKSRVREWLTTNSTKEQIVSNLAVRIAQNGISFNEVDRELFSQFGTFLGKFLKSGKMQFEAMSGCKDDRIMSLAIALQAKIDYDIKVTKNFIGIVKI